MLSIQKSKFKLAVEAAIAAGVDPNQPDALYNFVKTHAKDTVGPRGDSGWLYQNGPFSLIEGDVLSSITQGGSPLLQWLPTRLVTNRVELVQHLEWVAPHGFDGSQTYRDWLATITIADCDYGPTTDWSGFEYQMEGGEWSWQSPVVKIKDFGQRDFEKSPIYAARGDNKGLVALDNDADWGIARALIADEQHVNYITVYGERNNSQMEIDGLDQIIRPGYVASKRVGKGVAHFANPLVINGAILDTPSKVVAIMRAVARKILQRASDRGWNIAAGDIAFAMPSIMWMYIAEAMASTGGYTGLLEQNLRDFLAMRDSAMTSLSFNVDGRSIAILLDSTMGHNVTLNLGDANERSAVVGDIYLLVRRAGPETLLEMQYLDWNQFDSPADDSTFPILGGIARAGWKEINQKCFQYFIEQEGRLVTRFQPLQSRINNVVIETTLSNEFEGMNFTQQDFYAYDGGRGGQGTAFLSPSS